MGGWITEEDCPEQFRWIMELEAQQHPPLNTLLNICASFVAKNLEKTLLQPYPPPESGGKGGTLEGYTARSDVLLPLEVSQTLFEFCSVAEKDGSVGEYSGGAVTAFASPHPVDNPIWGDVTVWGAARSLRDFPLPVNPSHSLPLSTLDFSAPNNALSSQLLFRYLRQHGATLTTLNISGSTSLDHRTLEFINGCAPNLLNLIIGGATQIFYISPKRKLRGGEESEEDEEETLPKPQLLQSKEILIYGPRALSKLVIHGWIPQEEGIWGGVRGMEGHLCGQLVLTYRTTLTHLDFSSCHIINFAFLPNLVNLRALLLHRVDLGEDSPSGFFSTVPHLSKEIRHLDLSQPGSKSASWGTFRNPNQLLDSVVHALPLLAVLEISGTNLAGDGVAQVVWEDEDGPLKHPHHPRGASRGRQVCCDIPGLNSRWDRPLEYLGLYGCAHDASHRHAIPAKAVGGDKDELQIMSAARVFIDRAEVLERILNDLFHLFRTEEGSQVTHCLRLILCAMERHPREKHIQISGSASLFYIVKNNQNLGGPVLHLKRRILAAIVRAMELHVTDSTMLRNACLTICHFKIPQDVMFLYDKLVGILLEMLSSVNPPAHPEDFNERIAIYLLNSLACQVEGEHKRLVGNLGAIQKMLRLIKGRLGRGDCDDVMEIAWSTMWNVTDETPENCSKFLQNDGMALFLRCLEAFPRQPELLRNMMGLLGNVAEVVELRPHLMTEAFIRVFYELLNSKQDNIEVSYNAAGVLAHILSDGEGAWGGGGVWCPSRSAVCERMSINIREWDLQSLRNINYRSFKPILRLLHVSHTVQCRLWAAWALANLTTVYPEKYVSLLQEEDGLSYLAPQLDDSDHPELVHYARLAYNNVAQSRTTKPDSVPLSGGDLVLGLGKK